MSLELRARAALASLELFGLNPHQLRGPDGRFIKMPDSQLKRPRRPRKARAAADPQAAGVKRAAENPLYRKRREEYNVDVMQHVASDKVIMQDEDKYPGLYELHAHAEKMAEGPERDAVIDEMVDLLNERKTKDYPYRPPTKGGPEFAEAVGGGQRPGFDAPYKERQAALRRSVETGAVDEELIAQGQMGETRRFELADGTSAVYKKATRDWDRGWTRPLWTKKDQLDAEELSSRVAAALGVPAPAVHRASDDEIYMEFMPGVDPEVRWPGWREPPPGARKTPAAVRFGLLDVLIENTDRHSGNFLVNADDEPVAIDHGMAFSNTYRLDVLGQRELSDDPRNQAIGPYTLDHFLSFVNEYKPNPLTQSDVAKVRRRLESTRGEFDRLGHGDWYQAMLRRLDRVAANASGDANLY